MEALWQYIKTVYEQQKLLVGAALLLAALSFVDTALNWNVPPLLWIAAVVGCLFYAQYRAYSALKTVSDRYSRELDAAASADPLSTKQIYEAYRRERAVADAVARIDRHYGFLHRDRRMAIAMAVYATFNAVSLVSLFVRSRGTGYSPFWDDGVVGFIILVYILLMLVVTAYSAVRLTKRSRQMRLKADELKRSASTDGDS